MFFSRGDLLAGLTCGLIFASLLFALFSTVRRKFKNKELKN